MRIAIVSYNWPPRNAIGTHRPYTWARVWASLGHEVVVITAAKYEFDAPLDLHLEVPPSVEVVEIPYLKSSVFLNRLLDALRKSRLIKFARRSARRRGAGATDIRRLWVRAAGACICEASQRVDAVVSTFGPDGSHIIASRMKEENRAITWIADYRDLWSNNHNLVEAGDEVPALQKFEQQVLASANVLTTVSEELAAQLEYLHGKRTVVVSNGFDMSLDHLRERFKQVARASSRPLRIVYTGTIYPGRQDPSPLFEAIRLLIATGQISPDSVVVEFYGSRVQFDASVTSADLSFVKILGHVSREQALAAQRDADLLLLLERPGPSGRGVVTGKIFEYLASARPILSVGSDAESAIDRILQATGCGRCMEESVDDIADLILELQARGVPDWFQPQVPEVEKYSRVALAEKMLSLIEEARACSADETKED